jgi:hypothetical protein
VRERFRHTRYDAVLIGAGIRLVAANSRLFEALINLAHTELPDCRFVFNEGPTASAEDVLRWFPEGSRTSSAT